MWKYFNKQSKSVLISTDSGRYAGTVERMFLSQCVPTALSSKLMSLLYYESDTLQIPYSPNWKGSLNSKIINFIFYNSLLV